MSKFKHHILTPDIDREIKDQEETLKVHEAEHKKFKYIVSELRNILERYHFGPFNPLTLERVLCGMLEKAIKGYLKSLKYHKTGTDKVRTRLQLLYNMKELYRETNKGAR